MRIALGLEYDGTPFCGWQSQPGGCGLQDRLETALQLMAGHALRVTAAGRTDTGVHALSQVVHFDTLTQRPLSAWVRGVNANLPAAIRVLWAQIVDAGFHARFEAQQRSYQYLLFNRSVNTAVMANKAGWYHQTLDAALMAQACSYFIGEHDFTAFRAAECQARTPIKRMHKAEVKRIGDYLLFDFCGSAFLHHQVRNMVGALIYIGKRSHAPDYIQALLLGRDRSKAPPTFSADGLYLTGVGYDAKWGLPSTQRSLQIGL